MKPIKTLSLAVFSIALGSCFDAPEFSNTPRIQFNSIYYGQARTPSEQDSLVVELEFEDGDGDLGTGNVYRNYPFHEYDLFLTDGEEITDTIQNEYLEEEGSPIFVKIPQGATGTLVREGEELPGMPSAGCENYRSLVLNVREADKNIFNEEYSVEHVTNAQPPYYRVQGSFLAKANPYFNNIIVKFYRNATPGNPNSFVEFNDWGNCTNFNGRFLPLSDDDSPLSGKLTYTISSFGFEQVMGNTQETWKMEFTIYDRALHESNTVSTPAFTLQGIRR